MNPFASFQSGRDSADPTFSNSLDHYTALIVPLALTTIYRALNAQIGKHVRIAHWTFPIWLYVSVSGVIVYWMLYHLSPWP